MRIAGLLGLTVSLCALVPAAAQTAADPARAELATLYLASIAADRCEFALSEIDADTLIQTATALQKKLGIAEDAADKMYEEVEIEFEKKLPDACKKDGDIAKSFAQVIEKIRKK